MSEVVRVLTRKNSLRAVLRELSLNQLDKLLSDVNEIRGELEEEKRAEQAAEEARQAKIRELQAMMVESGINPEELVEGLSVSTKRQVKPKYRLMDAETGAPLEWTGRGRTPVWVTEYEQKGGKREDLLIE